MTKSRAEISGMFNRIAHRYDFLNRFLSFGTDTRWRRRAVSAIASLIRPETILDVATGTADLAIEALCLGDVIVTGIDISDNMLEEGRRKILRLGLQKKINLMNAPAEDIPFPSGSFDVAMAAFGVRNFSDTLGGLREMNRVLKPGGVIMVLEFSMPKGFLFSNLYRFYFSRVLPVAGRLISRDYSAYRYLPDSVGSFPEGAEFDSLLVEAGFGSTGMKRLTGGVATIYTARKMTMQ
ncbi:MAG: bifunctional demethylmenaquinone methyltransferase/2-methoxy-6-polyprenyl-1,4-benzoquinol methylase UbiE [Bacteroidetes bacterium]|nr:bifunctional demethylmenaquinone methyltransferase/2-methoxy-6-polyprenyl-1,4-benzoquinol methylase UbiE [Bacteroidota bacterium]